MSELLQAALAYHARGWSVVPAFTITAAGACSCDDPKCDRPGKHPRIRWAEYQKGRPSVEQIEAWWQQWPGSNIAVITGEVSGLVVVDLDGPEAQEGIEQLGTLPDTLKVTTGKGEHLYYQHPGGKVPNRVRLAPGVDVRGDGGYVMAPPSRHQSGRTYAWAGRTTVASALPQGVMTRLTGQSTSAEASFGAEPNKQDWVLEYLRGVPEHGGDGLPGRNEAATKLAGHYLRHHTPQETHRILAMWNKQNQPPLGAGELRRIVHSIASRVKEESTANGSLTELKVLTLEELMLLDEEVRWLVENIWVNQTVGWIAGPPKLGKTWLVLDLAVSVASGSPFLGHFPIQSQGPALLVLEEDTAPQLKSRLGKILEARGLAGTDKIVVGRNDLEMDFKMPAAVPVHAAIHQGFFFSPENLKLLEEHIARIEPAVVIMDPFYRMSRGFDEYKASEAMAEVLGPLADLRYKYKCAIVIVHHTTKNTKASRGGERMYGSMAFHAWSESAMHLTAGPKGKLFLEREFKSAAAGPRICVNFGDMNRGWNPEIGEEVETATFEDDITSEITALLSSTPLTTQEIADLTDTKIDRAKKVLEQLKQAGEADSIKAGDKIQWVSTERNSIF